MNETIHSDNDETSAPSAIRVGAETLIMTAAIPSLGWVLDDHDPFFLRRGFCWPLFAPLLIGLRFGFAAALTSAGMLDVALAVSWRTQPDRMPVFPAHMVLGIVALAIVCGQFSDIFQRQIRALRSRGMDARKQLEALGASYLLLERSHDRLVQRHGRPVPNLLHAFDALRAIHGSGITLRELAVPLLDLLARYFMIEVAAVYELEGRRLATPPLAVLGTPHPVHTDDPLVDASLRSEALVHVPLTGSTAEDTSTIAAVRASELVAVVPIILKSRIRAMICIETMPFMAFERRSLGALANLGVHLESLLGEPPLEIVRDVTVDILPEDGMSRQPAHVHEVK